MLEEPKRQEKMWRVEAASARRAYESARPFSHVVLRDVFNDRALRLAKKEAIEGLRADFKETDLFKVYQVPTDLGQIKTPHLGALRDALYSAEFRAMVRDVTGAPELADRVDCSANVYKEGGHLLCHDDAIGSRCVSYVVYLVDDDWNPENGGGFELFDATGCVGRVAPAFNSMVLFAVQPGASFHAVQEVYSGMRLSISGWYHAVEPPQGKSTLEDLSAGTSEPMDPSYFRSDDHPLSEWIAPEYLEDTMLSQLSQRFAEESAIRLDRILRPDLAARLREECSRLEPTDDWEPAGPPHKRRYVTASSGLFWDIAQKTRTISFQKWLQNLSGVRPEAARCAVRRFRPGSDYTIACATNEPARLDLTFCFLATDSDLWDSGDVGGFETYLAADDDDREDVYESGEGEGDGSDLLSVRATHNALTLVLRDPGTLRFVKYISKAAPSSRFDIELVCQLHPDDLPDPLEEQQQLENDDSSSSSS
ncbi:hypothetical protein CTAYLR_002989 [Chrysophaeum taylorii]|uniref:Fe2OG dioxygenase domain-containing protein n=1 Tax=Chrysophaeum taylorii TaxID=2483200 RepID=A0AAD7U713_9STRA|nr:hypothetical protein CTAYLR_002989 [Chrysophaeum taylorii]